MRTRKGLGMDNALTLDQKDLTVILIPKSASSSLLNAAYAADSTCVEKQSHVDRPCMPNSVALWREPTARAWSAYKFLQQAYTPVCKAVQHQTEWSDCSEHYFPRTDVPYDEFLYELARTRDRAGMIGPLTPQHEYCKGKANLEMVPWDFDRMAEVLGVAIPRDNPGQNRTPMPDLTSEMEQHLRITYGADYIIWDLING